VINTLETPTAKTNVASFFRKLDGYALENDIIHKSYAQFVDTPSKNRKTKKTPFLAEEVMLFWDHIGDVNAEIMLMLCYSGMRVSELLTLKKEQINLEENYIITGSKTEAGKDRYIPIHPRTKPLLEKHMANKTEWAIVNRFGDKPIRYDSFHAKRWSKLKKKLQFRDELTIHSTRHFFVSELHKHGADKIAVQKIVGHKGEDITDDTYTHISNQFLHETVLLLT
jgi:integrase